MDGVLKTAEADRLVLVDLDHDLARRSAHCSEVGGLRTEVKVAVLVHGSHLQEGDRRLLDIVLAVEARELRIAHGVKEAEALGDRLSLPTAEMPGVPAEVLGRVFNLKDGGLPHQDAAANLDVAKLRHAERQCLVDGDRRADTPAVVNPVAGPNECGGLFRAHKFLFVCFVNVHFDLRGFFKQRSFSSMNKIFKPSVTFRSALFNAEAFTARKSNKSDKLGKIAQKISATSERKNARIAGNPKTATNSYL